LFIWKFDRIIETHTTYPVFNADNHLVLLPSFYASFLGLQVCMRKYLYVSGFAQVFAHRCLWLVALVWVAYVHK